MITKFTFSKIFHIVFASEHSSVQKREGKKTPDIFRIFLFIPVEPRLFYRFSVSFYLLCFLLLFLLVFLPSCMQASTSHDGCLDALNICWFFSFCSCNRDRREFYCSLIWLLNGFISGCAIFCFILGMSWHIYFIRIGVIY